MVRVVKPPTKDEMSVGWAAPHPMAKVLPSLRDASVGDLGDHGGQVSKNETGHFFTRPSPGNNQR